MGTRTLAESVGQLAKESGSNPDRTIYPLNHQFYKNICNVSGYNAGGSVDGGTDVLL